MDTSKAVTHLGLCAGYGGIELGLKRAIPSLRSIALCEVEAFAIANLVAKMESGQLEPAPIWPDLKTFPWESFRDRVDILTGGYPCQPFSAAGQRRGKDDPRHLWPFIADGIRLLRPRLCFFENVEGHISLGLSDVIEDLAGMGYRTTWGIFSAAEVGAPHQRKRVFILAHNQRQRVEELNRRLANGAQQHTAGDHGGYAWPSRPGEQQYGWEPPRVVAHSDTGTRSPKHKQQKSSQRGETTERSATQPIGSSAMADSHRIDRSAPAEGREHDRQVGSAGEELGDSKIWDGEGKQVHLRQGQGEHRGASGSECSGRRQTQPPLGGDTDGPAGGLDYAELCITCDNRTDELRLLGNGVVPATAERAFRTLIRELL